MAGIIIKNRAFTLTLGEDCLVKSLILNATGEELVYQNEDVSLFSVTQLRPFNNEVKLAHPNKYTVYQARSVRREGDVLHVAFEIVPVKARVRLTEKSDYVVFTLEGFDVCPEDYGGLKMNTPPVQEFRLIQLPVKRRAHYGEWLNVEWDETAAINVQALSYDERIDSEPRRHLRLLTADAVSGIKLTGAQAALIVNTKDALLDSIDALEKDYGLPRGVASRKSAYINRSMLFADNMCRENVDEHITCAKAGGITLMLISYNNIFAERKGYALCGNYDFNERYPNGAEDVKYILKRIKDAGITPGLHFLQTHIGLESRYVTPKCDSRLGLKRLFTLSRPFSDGDTELYVNENPLDSEMTPECRFMNFGGELISYEGYTTEYPYKFFGCGHCAKDTLPAPHPAGQIGGILDISEFGAISCYVNQDSDLEDEIAEKLARVYNLGFEFCYMDGSEGANPPYERNVPRSQFRVYKRFSPAPLFTEGAAKAHFSWHFQAGGNAFDIFKPEIFKPMLVKHPYEEAPHMQDNFTRLDFGWWGFYLPGEYEVGGKPTVGTQADMYEYGTSLAAAWDCPVSIQINLSKLRAHPRAKDIMEVMRRWEQVRKTGWLTEETRKELKKADIEHTLLIDKNGAFRLVSWHQIEAPENIRAFAFEFEGRAYVAYWHINGSGTLGLPFADVTLESDIGTKIPFGTENSCALLPADDKKYVSANVPLDALEAAFAGAKLL